MKKKIVTFDFDDTLVTYTDTGRRDNIKVLNIVKEYLERGYSIGIVTFRYPDESHEIVERMSVWEKEHGIVFEAGVHYTSQLPKTPIITELESESHYDDMLCVLMHCAQHNPKVQLNFIKYHTDESTVESSEEFLVEHAKLNIIDC